MIVLANGVFDVIHVGHIELLKFASTLGRVVVAIDSDSRVRSNKGHDRPVNSQDERKRILEALRYVDSVLIFSNEEELRAIHRDVSPDFLVKGSDWDKEYIRKNDGVLEKTKIIIFDRMHEYSTTKIIQRIRCGNA
jgi:rfaE bifunctional protein nucleotidyltransferase chain/domain